MSDQDEKPFTLNVLYRYGPERCSDTNVETTTYATLEEALKEFREEVKWENTIHATITDERTGQDLYDEPGDFANLHRSKQ